MVGQALALQEAHVARLVEGDLVPAGKREAPGLADSADDDVGFVGIALVGALAREAEQDGTVGGVAFAGQRQAAVKRDIDPLGLLEQRLLRQRIDKAAGGRHRPHGMRARRADPDLEEIENGSDQDRVS
jgi:hypothetical protein